LGIPDNLGNTFAVGRLMTSKFPSVVILAEFAEQLKMRQAELGLLWVPRDQNEEADDLTNGEFGRFSEEKRIRSDFEKVKWLVMDDLVKSAESLYQEVKSARGLRGATAPGLVGGERRGRRRPRNALEQETRGETRSEEKRRVMERTRRGAVVLGSSSREPLPASPLCSLLPPDSAKVQGGGP